VRLALVPPLASGNGVLSVVAPDTVRLVIVVVARVEVLEAVKFVTVVVAKVATPETVSAPDRLRLAPIIEPVTARLVDVAFVNTPVLGVVAPIEVPLIVPPEIVTLLDVRLVMVWLVPVAEVYVKFVLLRVVAKKLVLVALPNTEFPETYKFVLVAFVATKLPIVALVTDAVDAEKFVVVAFVNTPVDGVVAPIEVPLIVPPVIVALLDVRLVIVPFVIV